MNKKFQISSNPFIGIEPVESKQSDLLQISDIILGAMGYQKNGYTFFQNLREAKLIYHITLQKVPD